MKEKLMKLLKAKQDARAAKMKEVDKATEVAELRALQAAVEAIDEEIRNIQSMIDELPEEGEEGQSERTAAVNRTIPGVVTAPQTTERNTDKNDMEYRKAFQQFVTRGTPIPVEYREDESTLTTDIASAIPTVLVDRIVEKMESVGMILPLFTKTSYAAGVVIPTSTVKPVATWVSEGASSDRQKKTTGTISFGRFKLRCEISMSAEAGALAIAAFESTFVKQVSEAMVKKIEATAISTADGTTSPKGILAETPASGQALTAKTLTYKLLVDAEAALPQAYENGSKWCMTKKTFMGFIGIEDAEGQPIARTNYGIGGVPERTLLGREVIICDYLDTFSSTLTAGKIFAFIFNFADYAINTVYDMGIQRKQDWDTEDILSKAVMSLDGKVVDKNSLVTIAKIA